MADERRDAKGRLYPVPKGPPEGGWPTLRLRALNPRPRVVPALIAPLREQRARRGKEKTTDERRTPLEILSRLAGGTTFKDPAMVRSTRGQSLTNADIAAAIGYVGDALDQRLALAVACQTDLEWRSIQRLAYPALMQDLLASHATRSLVAGKLKYRARVVLHDAFHDVALLRRPRPELEAATQLDMPPRDYRKLYKVTAGFIETHAQEGARLAVDALYHEG